jgi:hypothetical protein
LDSERRGEGDQREKGCELHRRITLRDRAQPAKLLSAASNDAGVMASRRDAKTTPCSSVSARNCG